jgi:lipopolysaccharide export system protein LptC
VSLHADADLRPPRPPRPARRRPGTAHPVQTGGHHRYSRFVGTMKLVLPSVAAVILGLVIAWPELTSHDDKFKIGFAQLSPNSVENLSMVNARFFGINRRNQPFTVTADVATEDEPGSGLIVLDQPKADFLSPSGKGIYVESRRGFYNQKTQLLDLEGEVNLYHEDGYEMHTEKARVDLKASTAEGHVPVTGHGPQGKIDGEGFRILDKGQQVVVTGRSSMNLKGAGSK